ncbi:MAG: archease [Bacillota bacterium]
MSRPYEVLEHTADIGIRARGRTPEETFANMALGMMSLIVPEPGRILEREERRVEARAADLEGLLVAWLSEFVYLVDAERFLVAKIEDIRIDRREPRREPGQAAGRAAVQTPRQEVEQAVVQTPGQTAAWESWRAGERGTAHPDEEGTYNTGVQGTVGGGFGSAAGSAAWTVTALVRGEGIDPARHPLEMEIKGVSYHMVKVERVGEPGRAGAVGETGEVASDENVQGDGWVAQAIFDI